MFDNIGDKIKATAYIGCFIGIACSIFGGFAMIIETTWGWAVLRGLL